MSTATKAAPAPLGTLNPAPKARGFPGLRCLLCGEEDTLRLDLENLSLSCGANDCEIEPAEVRSLIALWQKLLAWLETAPPAGE
jgi:hypothetical protein